MRGIPEWRGRTDDTAIPPRVKLRVLEAYAHRCYLTRQPIEPGAEFEIEHVLAISLGGENRENNLAPVLIAPHREKTRADVKAKAKIALIKKKRFGLAGSKWKRPLPGSRASGWKRTLGPKGSRWERRV